MYDDEIKDYNEAFGAFAVIGENGAQIAQESFEDAFIASGADVVVRSRLTDVLGEIEFQNLSGLTADDAAPVPETSGTMKMIPRWRSARSPAS